MKPIILVDADACPVKTEVQTIAVRHGIYAVFVSNAPLRLPPNELFKFKLVSGDFDAADDWIAENAKPNTVVTTADILLAERCLDQGSEVIGNNGKPFTQANIGNAVAVRAIMADLRAGAGSKNDSSTSHIGGPAPFAKTDRSRFLASLHEAVERIKRMV